MSDIDSQYGCVRFHNSSFSVLAREAGNRGCMAADGTIAAAAFAASERSGEEYVFAVLDNHGGKLPPEYGVITSLLVQQVMMHALYVSAGKQVFQFSARMVQDFHRTDLSETPIGRLHLPYAAGFLHFGLQEDLALDNVWRTAPEYVDGAYYHLGPKGQLTVQLTLSRPGGKSSGLPGPYFSLDPGDLECSAHSSVDRALDRLCATERDESDRMSGLSSEFRDWEGVARPVIHRSLSLVLNAMFYLDGYGADTQPMAPEAAPPHLQQMYEQAATSRKLKKTREAVRALEQAGFSVVRLCGIDRSPDESAAATEEHQKNVRMHWRRGHWRMQPHGPQLSRVRRTWIRPTLVSRQENQIVPGHRYIVEHNRDEP